MPQTLDDTHEVVERVGRVHLRHMLTAIANSFGYKATNEVWGEVQADLDGALQGLHTYSDGDLEDAAVAAYRANKAYCESIGDAEPLPYDAIRESLIEGIKGVIAGNGPEQSHESWLAFKHADGWIYGPVKDLEAKTHPCMVPYDALPEAQRQKDDIFITSVRESLGL